MQGYVDISANYASLFACEIHLSKGTICLIIHTENLLMQPIIKDLIVVSRRCACYQMKSN